LIFDIPEKMLIAPFLPSEGQQIQAFRKPPAAHTAPAMKGLSICYLRIAQPMLNITARGGGLRRPY